MTKYTAIAPANIAFIKYWGKRDERLRIPANNSISMNLSEIYTQTSVEFVEELKEDYIQLDGNVVKGREQERVTEHLDKIRYRAKIKVRARVETQNNFPKGTGLASSASGFAALTLAATKAAGLNLPEKHLSILARIGSGSACRSIPDGFVEWKAAKGSEGSYAYSMFPADYWAICDVIAVVGEQNKKISSTEGHGLVESSQFYKTRLKDMPGKIKDIKVALKTKDFTKLGEICEAEALNMHAVMLTSQPALIYWQPRTLEIMQSVIAWRSEGLESYFTIDAGPNVHILCQTKDATKLKLKLEQFDRLKVIINRPAQGAHLI